MAVHQLLVARSRPVWTLALTAVAFFMVTLDTLVVVTALPAIQRDLHASLSMLEWTVNAFTLAFAAGIITAAALGDRLGRRRIFTIGLALFSVASAACALAPSAEMLIAARAVQGLSGAMIMPLSLTILVSAFPPERRGAIVGIYGGIGGLAVASGPLIGGAITQGLDWHWIFWVNVPIGLVATVLARLLLAESHGPATRLDLPAAALVSGGAIAIVWGLIRTTDVGWGSAQVIAALILGVVLIAGFLAWERRASDPMLPLRLFESRGFAAANLTGFLMAGAITSAAFLMAQYCAARAGRGHAFAGHWAGPDRHDFRSRRELRPIRRAADHRRDRDLDGDPDRVHGRLERSVAARHGQGLGREQHAAALWRGLRGCNRRRRLHGERTPWHRSELHRRVPAGAGRGRRPFGAGSNHRPGRSRSATLTGHGGATRARRSRGGGILSQS